MISAIRRHANWFDHFMIVHAIFLRIQNWKMKLNTSSAIIDHIIYYFKNQNSE